MGAHLNHLKSTSQMPGYLGLPFLGETLALRRTEELFYWKRFQRYGPVFKTRILGRKLAVLVGTEANQFVLQDQDSQVSSEIGWSFLQHLFGQGVLLQDGRQHQVTRRLLYPAFHTQAVRCYFSMIQKTVNDFFKDWNQRRTVAVLGEFRKLTLTIATRLFLGSQTSQEIEQTSRWFKELVAGRIAFFHIDVPWTVYGRSQQARRRLQAFLKTVIQERQQDKLNEFNDVLGLLIFAEDEDGNQLSESEVIDQALLLLFAGHETTAMLLSWLLYELGVHPYWQECLRDELNQIVGNEPLALNHLKQLTQMSYVLKEVERLYPPIYGIPRGLVKEMVYAGYRIPPGWKVIVSPFLTHRMSEIYNQPNKFDPERFAPPREEHKKHPFALVGFGGGPHKCLGYEFAQMEMKVILATLLRNFTWSASPERRVVTPILPASKVDRMLKVHVKSL